jgi:hypothetical protein
VRPAREKKLPAILSRDEVHRNPGVRSAAGLRRVPDDRGLRLQEGTQLQVAGVDSARGMLHIHGKGRRDGKGAATGTCRCPPPRLTDPDWSLAEELAGAQFPTHLGRMLQDLGIAYVAAHSPQAPPAFSHSPLGPRQGP